MLLFKRLARTVSIYITMVRAILFYAKAWDVTVLSNNAFCRSIALVHR